MSRRADLTSLLLSLFEAEELRAFLRHGPSGEEIVTGLPSKYDSAASIADAAVEALERHTLVTRELFDRLVEARPDAAEQIDSVRLLFFPNEPPNPPPPPWWRQLLRVLPSDGARLRRMCVLIVGSVGLLGFSRQLDAPVNWTLLTLLREPLDPKKTLVVILSRSATVREERLQLAEVVTRLTHAGAKAIVLDHYFPSTDAEGDAALVTALDEAGDRGLRVVAGATRAESRLAPPANPEIAARVHLAHLELEPQVSGWLPLTEVHAREKGTGGDDSWALPVQALRAGALNFPAPNLTSEALEVAECVSCAPAGRVMLHPTNPVDRVHYPSEVETFDGYGGFTVFVGEDRAGDQYSFLRTTVPGVFVHASLYVTLREQAAPCPATPATRIGLAAAAAMAAACVRRRSRRMVIVGIGIGLCAILAYLALVGSGILPSLALVAAAAGLVGAWPRARRQGV